jgi:hypothetical protein
MQIVIRKVLFDDIPFVAEAHNEILDAERGVVLHDMPEYRFTTDLDHGFWPQYGLLTDPRSEAPSKNHGLHIIKWPSWLAENICMSRDGSSASWVKAPLAERGAK